MCEPCSLLLWRRGRWSGLVLEVLGRCTGHIRPCVSWELQYYLGHGGQRAGRCVRSRGLVGAETEPSWEARRVRILRLPRP